MRDALARHDALLRQVIENHGGFVFKTVGDAFYAAFPTAEPAIRAALAAQRGLRGQDSGFREDSRDLTPEPRTPIPLRVRMALHTGEPILRDNDYFGPLVNRVARILAAGHGGQILLSSVVWEETQGRLPPGASIIDHGAHRLKDLTTPERLFQLVHPDLPSEFPPLRSLSSHPNNLPAQMTTFVGREREMQEMRELLDGGARLVTLTGAGGTGKTRIALQIAADRVERYPGGVWWVDLAPVREAAQVMPTIAAALQIREEPNVTARQQIADYLREEKALLVLDNFEQVLDAAEDVADLLRTCRNLTALVTSRAVLNLSVEQEYAVPEMGLEESVSLFTVRAQQVRAGFTLDAQTRPIVENLCRRLDGIPLATELAAAQVRMLTVASIEKQLSQRFRVLVSPFRDVAQRQRTLRAAVDWSYDLLTEAERYLFACLSMFVGSFTLEAAETVGESDEVFPGVMRLREQSLLRADETADPPRFRMLETLREYGQERLREIGQHEMVAARHARYYADLARRSDRALSGDGAEQAMAALAADADNLRAALAWLFAHGAVEEAADMSLALAEFWERHGWWREGRQALARCLERPQEIRDDRRRARLYGAAGWFAHLLSDYDAADALQEQSLILCRQLGDEEGETIALNNRALNAHAQNRLDDARTLYEASLEIARKLGDEVKQAARLGNLGWLATQEGRHEDAQRYLEEARAIYERRRDLYGTAACLCNLGDLALRQKDWEAAERYSAQGLQLFRELDDQRGIASTLANLAEVAAQRRDYDHAEQHVREALSICVETEMQGLAPILLETLARVKTACGAAREGAYFLAAADRLRGAFAIERSPEEQEQRDKLASAHRAALGDETLAVLRADAAGLTLHKIAGRV